MARPRLKQGEKRTAPLRVRLTPSEAAQVAAQADAAGLSVPDYVRAQILAGRVTVQQTTRLEPPVWLELRRIGVNLNQIARAMNAAGLDRRGLAVVEAKGREVVALLTRPDDELPDSGGADAHEAEA